jgi:hypothetical protein
MSTQLVNALDTYDAAGANREDIHDIVSLITPDETPAFTLLNRGSRSVDAAKHEWTIDDLAAPDTDNANVQGFTYTFDASDVPDRVGNYTQIFDKTFLISKTQEAVKKVGRNSDVTRQKMKKGMEIRIDIEAALLSNQASVAGSGSVPPRMAGLRAWLATNDSMGSGGSSGGYNTSTGVVDAATNGTQRAFTKTLLDDTIQSAYTAGGSPKQLMVSPYVKRIFSTFMSDANVAAFRTQLSGEKKGTIYGAADVYVSDFGSIDVIPNRQMARVGASIARNAFLLDEGKARLGWLRKIQEDKDVQRSGDAIPGVMVGEVTLIVDNEAAHGVIADLNGMTVSS